MFTFPSRETESQCSGGFSRTQAAPDGSGAVVRRLHGDRRQRAAGGQAAGLASASGEASGAAVD